jgi:RNA polymerase sigma-70 factor (ECF subfamily)
VTDDRQLIDAARAGDPGALEALLRLHEQRVYRFSMKMCRNPQDAEDVLQDTLLTAVRKVGEFRGQSSLSTWLYAIARSFCLRRRRGHALARAAEPLEGRALEVPDRHRLPDEEVAGRELERVLERAIDDLDAKYREVLLLRDVEGLDTQEVADVLALGVPAVKTRLHRARAAVRAALAPHLAPPPASARSCPDVVDLLSRKLEGEISPALCAEMERHLEACPACRDACDSLKQTLSMCRRVATPEVPSAVQASVRRAIQALNR